MTAIHKGNVNEEIKGKDISSIDTQLALPKQVCQHQLLLRHALTLNNTFYNTDTCSGFRNLFAGHLLGPRATLTSLLSTYMSSVVSGSDVLIICFGTYLSYTHYFDIVEINSIWNDLTNISANTRSVVPNS